MSVTVAMPREYRSWWEWRYEMFRQAGLLDGVVCPNWREAK